LGLSFAIIVHQFRREAEVALEHLEALETLVGEHGFQTIRGQAAITRGWALAEQGQVAEGILQMRQGLAVAQAQGPEGQVNYCHPMLAGACGKAGQVAEGLEVLEAALALVHKNAERYFEAELYRLKGDLLLQQTNASEYEAEASFQQALAIARQQQAKSLELRAAMSLARLWQCQGKRAEARELLAPVYGWFTEGFDTADLQEAKALLAALS
jgi:predicted ATPase